jgi:dTMP kinase
VTRIGGALFDGVALTSTTPVSEPSTARVGSILAAPGVNASRFTVLEGLSAVGKSTVAPMLADALGAEFIRSVLPEFHDIRRYVAAGRSVMARLHFWFMSNYALSQKVGAVLAGGRDVVVESYFYRTLATHAAMGATYLPEIDWGRAVVPDLAVLLSVDEAMRQARMAQRGRSEAQTFWQRLEESNVAVTRQVYGAFGLVPIDTTGLSPVEVTSRLVGLVDSVGVRRV